MEQTWTGKLIGKLVQNRWTLKILHSVKVGIFVLF